MQYSPLQGRAQYLLVVAAAQLTRSESPYLFMLTMQIMKDPKEMIAAVNEQLAARGVYGRVAYAESAQWIDFAMNAAVE